VEPAFIYLTSLSFALAGASPLAQRAVAAVIGSLTVPALYALGRELERDGLPTGVAIFSSLALSFSYWHLTFSRVGIEPILVPLLLTLAMWALWRGLRTGRLWPFALAGVLAGLGPYTYPAGRLIPILYLAAILYFVRFQRERWRSHQRALVMSLVVAALVFLPLGAYWALHPDLLLLRASQVTVVAGFSPASPLDNLVRTLAMFTLAGDADPRSNIPGRPALDLFIALWFYLGIGAALARWRRPGFALPLLGSAIMLLPTIFSDYAPHFRRALGATPAVMLLIGIGAAWFLAQARSLARRAATAGSSYYRSLPILAASLVAVTFVGSLGLTARDYFTRWGASPDLYYAYDVGLWDVARYAATFPADDLVYLTPRPETHTTLAFAWRQRQPPITFDGRSIFPFRAQASQPQHYLVIEHEDFRTPLLIHDLFPNLETVRDFRDRSGRVYARHYLIPAGSLPQPVTDRPAGAQWPGMTLRSYTLLPDAPHPGDVLYLRLLWEVNDPPPAGDWTTFVHLLDSHNPALVVEATDARPGDGSYPTDRWQPGQSIVDEYQIRLPADLPPGAYPIEVGFYLPDGERVPAHDSSGVITDHIQLDPAQVSAP
jgi:hypothetical protein